MSQRLLICALCPDRVHAFVTPGGDGIGEALMREHLKDKHGLTDADLRSVARRHEEA